MSAQPFLLIAIGGLIFAAAALITFGTSGYFGEQGLLRRRLSGNHTAAPTGRSSAPGSIVIDDTALKQFARFVTPKSEQDRTAVRTRLIRAGYRNPSAVRLYFAYRAGLGLGSAIVSSLFIPIFAPRLEASLLLLAVLTATTLGFLLPSFWVERRIQMRRQAAEEGFPDALDMLLVCIEAGQGLDQALNRLSYEIRAANPTLAQEFAIVGEELRAGKDRVLVLREFSERLGVSDISAFMAVLKQSDEFGVSIADAVRVYAAEMRNKRVMRAEEKANLLPVKLALGSMMFTVPPVMVILGAPSFIMILRSFAGMEQ